MTKIESKLVKKRLLDIARNVASLIFDKKYLRAYDKAGVLLHIFYHDIKNLDPATYSNCLYDFVYFRRLDDNDHF